MTYRENDLLRGYADAVIRATSKGSESVYQEIADRFEDSLLEFDDFPAEYFDLVLALLSEERFYSRPGLWNFLMVLSTENQKLTVQHHDRLANAIVEHYSSYLDKDLCLAVCDFVARNYRPDHAHRVLSRLKEIESAKAQDLRGLADQGLWILEREMSRRSDKGPSSD